jgi:putative ABC transport system permease protein
LIELLGEAAPFMLVLLGFILVLVLAIACANVSNVMLAHLMARQREFAIRAALGATRLRQVRQLLFEALVVSLVAGALGAVLASWGLSAIRLGMGSEIGQLSELAVNGRVLAAAALMAGLAPLGFALLPAFRVSGGYTEALRQGGRSGAQGSGSHRLLGLSVAGQVALTCVLCVEVGFLARAGWRLHVQEKGLNPANVLTLRLALPDTTYETPQEIWAFADQLLTRIGQLPGVRSAGAASRLPIADRELTVEFTLEGRPVPAPEERPWAARAAITPGYLPALGIPLVRGRHVGAMDTSETPPVVLVSQEAERRYWPNGDAIGKRIQFASSEIWTEIIGVVGDVRNSDAEGIDGGAITRTPQVYVPMAQSPERLMALMVRTDASDPVELAPAIREQVLRLDRNQPIFDVASMEQVLFEDLVGTYLLVTILGGVALVAMALAAAGISGMVGHAVVQRIPEIGIRMALGAQPGAMALMVVMQGLTAAAIGGVVGVGGSIALVSLTAGAIGDVNPNEPLIYVGTVGVLVTVATLAGYLPARRAARVDPLVALRYE